MGATPRWAGAWRGPEKKDAQESHCGCGWPWGWHCWGVLQGGRNRLKSVGPKASAAPARDIAPLKAVHSDAMRHAHTAAADRGASEGRLAGVRQQHSDWVDRDTAKRKRGVPAQEHPLKGMPAVGHPGKGNAPAGKVGPRGGGIEFHIRPYEKDLETSHANWQAHDTKATGTHRAIKEAETHNAGRHAVADAANVKRAATIKGPQAADPWWQGRSCCSRWPRCSWLQGIKAEQDRGTGFGKPSVVRRLSRISEAQRRVNGL